MAGAIQHNGLFGKVAAVTALKLRLVRLPLRLHVPWCLAPFGFTKPPLCLAPQAPRARPALTRCSARRALAVIWPACPCLRHRPRGFWSGAARSLWCWPPPTRCGPGALRLWPSAGSGPSAPKGLPPARRCGGVACVGVVPVRHGSLAHRRAAQQPARSWRTNPIPLWGRGCSSGARQSRPLRAAYAVALGQP